MRKAVVAVLALMTLPLSGCIGVGTDDVVEPASLDEATGFILFNATVWTADDDVPWATAVAVRGDRIVAVGSDDEVRGADVGDRPIEMDLDGAMVLPGFHDTHNHFVEVARAADPANGNPYEPWPPGWDPVAGTIGQQMTAAGHVGVWAQRNADRVQDGEAPFPPSRMHGVELDLAGHAHDGADDGHLAPEGRLAANDLFFGEPDRVNDEHTWKQMLKLGLETSARFGITSHVEAGTSPESFDVLEELDAAGELSARFHMYLFPEDLDTAVDRGWMTGHGDDDVQWLGLKIYSDGWLGPRTAAMRDLYNDRPHQGFAFYTQDEVDEYVMKAHRNGLKLTAHTIGDRATEMLLSAYEKALAQGCDPDAPNRVCSEPRFTLEHVQLVQPDLMERMVAVGLVPSVQLSFATSDAPWAEDALGPDRIQHAYPWKTMVDEGLVVGGSSDFPIEAIPPLWGLQRVVTRSDLNGQPEGGFMTGQALALDTALRTVTINAAHLTYREHELGSVTTGKYADLVVLGEDLFSIPADQIADTEVLMTMKGGHPVYTADPVTGLLPD